MLPFETNNMPCSGPRTVLDGPNAAFAMPQRCSQSFEEGLK